MPARQLCSPEQPWGRETHGHGPCRGGGSTRLASCFPHALIPPGAGHASPALGPPRGSELQALPECYEGGEGPWGSIVAHPSVQMGPRGWGWSVVPSPGGPILTRGSQSRLLHSHLGLSVVRS